MPLKVDAEKEGAALAKQYKVQGYPTILFVNAQGELFAKIGGYMPPEGFAQEMTKALTVFKELPAIQSKLKANPNDPEANARMAAVCASREQPDRAVAHLAKAEKSNYKGAAMAPAYSAVGDHFQTAGQFDKAIGYFKKASATSTNPTDKSYALVSIMSCQMSKNDMPAAKATAKELAALKGGTPEYVKMAQDLLKGG